MNHFILEQSESEIYTSHSGLALVGLCLNRYGTVNQALNAGIPQRHGIAHSDITVLWNASDLELSEKMTSWTEVYQVKNNESKEHKPILLYGLQAIANQKTTMTLFSNCAERLFRLVIR